MSDLKNIRKFEYRPCRIETGFNVEFATGRETLQGLCKDVSEAGIRVMLDGPLVVGSSGLLTLRHPRGVLEIEAQVVYTDRCHAGLAFLFQTRWELEAATEYISAIVNSKAAPLIVRFP